MDVELIGLILNVQEYPHPNVELPLFEKQWPLDVLLDNPLRIGRLLVEELKDVPNFVEKLNSFALIESSRFKNPLIVSAMLVRDVLVAANSFSDMQV